MSRFDSGELKGDAPEEAKSDVNHPRLSPSIARNNNNVEVKSVQNLNPFYLNILSDVVSESIVNAVWNQLLREVFQYPGFVLAPEYYTPDDNKVDLVVCANTGHQLVSVFAYEGKKGPISDTEFLKALAQAARYLKFMHRMENGRYYGMTCAGRKVAIIEYQQGGGRNQIKQVIGPNLLLDVTDDIRAWDIERQAAKIDIILGAIFQEVLRS